MCHYTINVEELKVDKRRLTSCLRKKTSAYDGRLSSKVLGATVSLIIVAIISVIVVLDTKNLIDVYKEFSKTLTFKFKNVLSFNGPCITVCWLCVIVMERSGKWRSQNSFRLFVKHTRVVDECFHVLSLVLPYLINIARL